MYAFTYQSTQVKFAWNIRIWYWMNVVLQNIQLIMYDNKWGTELYLGRNSVMIERFGGRVTAPMKRTTFGCRSLSIIRTLYYRREIKNADQWFWIDSKLKPPDWKKQKKINKVTWPHKSCYAIPFYHQMLILLKVGLCSFGDSYNRGDIKKLKLDWNSHDGIDFFHIRQQKVFATASLVVPSHPAPSLTAAATTSDSSHQGNTTTAAMHDYFPEFSFVFCFLGGLDIQNCSAALLTISSNVFW